MKKIFVFVTMAMFSGAYTVFGQRAQNAAIEAVATKVEASKTMTSWDVLSNLYQIGLNNLTADDKSVGFKSTIYGLHKIFNPKINDSKTYKDLAFERHFEPYLNFNYKDKFDPSNLTAGFNFSFINANDKTESNDLSKFNKSLWLKIKALDDKLDPFIKSITPDERMISPAGRTMVANGLDAIEDQIADFVKSGDDSGLDPGLKTQLMTAGIYQDVKDLNDQIDEVALTITNRWNVTFSPQVTYAFNRSTVQGASFLFNGLKGFKILPKRSTQLTLKAGYIMGDDTVVAKSAVGRHQFSSQLGFNQVIFIKTLTADDGTASKVPCTELAVNYGVNYLTRGYSAADKRRQETLNAKLGFLIGKDSWLVIPFTYNYATKTSYASISVKVNLGDAPFK